LQAQASAVADAFYRQPSASLMVAAVTGTNGKSSVAWWLAHALSALQQRSGLIGTLGQGWPDALQPNPLTTPDALQLQATLAALRDQGAAACVMEASSIGLAQSRLEAVRVRLAVYTHFSQDHLDFHGDMASYWQAKRRLFEWPSLQAAVVHVGDAQGQQLAAALSHLPVWSYASCHRSARLASVNERVEAHGVTVQLVERDPGGTPRAQATAHWPVMGAFNVRNRLAVLASLRALDVPWEQALAVLPGLPPVPGRMQPVWPGPGRPLVLVDYAHTPDALTQALQALQPVAKARGGRLWCVFGCGGNRDRSKRALMGQAAQALAHVVVLTSDNPRYESPQAIVNDIAQGMSQAPKVVLDRALAIAQSIA
ncbi:MAG: UDP-N-acetylmuramoyl-L-alanyl-D-glutamate--2,6-diaminopimelate ligase, partial [Burkholderiaceae bacterium]